MPRGFIICKRMTRNQYYPPIAEVIAITMESNTLSNEKQGGNSPQGGIESTEYEDLPL